MKPTYPINYRGGWMQPAVEYVPEVRKSRPTWKPNKKLPDYGPIIDEPPHPRHFFDEHPKSYQKIQYREPFHVATPVTEFVNEPHVLDPIESNADKMEPPTQSSLREPLHFHDTYGQALSNIYAVLQMGVQTLDTSVAGLGGCPYAKGATGNVATEDVLYMLNGIGIKTGIKLEKIIEVSWYISNYMKRLPNSRVARAYVNK